MRKIKVKKLFTSAFSEGKAIILRNEIQKVEEKQIVSVDAWK